MSRVVKCDNCHNPIPTEFINIRETEEYLGLVKIKVRKFNCPACKKVYICSVIDETITKMQQIKISIMDEYLEAVSKANKESDMEMEIQEIAQRYETKNQEMSEHLAELKELYKIGMEE